MEPFPYALLSALGGQGGWTPIGGMGNWVGIGGGGVVNATFGDTGDDQAVHTVGFDPSTPWVLTATVKYVPGSDDGPDFKMILDNAGNRTILDCQLTAGDGAANKISFLDLSDTALDDTTLDVPFTANELHSLTITFNGTTLVASVDGTPRATLASYVPSGINAPFRMTFATSGPSSDTWQVHSVSITQ